MQVAFDKIRGSQVVVFSIPGEQLYKKYNNPNQKYNRLLTTANLEFLIFQFAFTTFRSFDSHQIKTDGKMPKVSLFF